MMMMMMGYEHIEGTVWERVVKERIIRGEEDQSMPHMYI
jgi:hypothetical protein